MTDASSNLCDVYCLCAGWCSTCGAFKPALDTFQMAGFRVHWVDIEDHDEALEDLDITTFPTLVVADSAGGILFAGPVEPRLTRLTRLLQALHTPGTSTGPHESWARVVRKLRA